MNLKRFYNPRLIAFAVIFFVSVIIAAHLAAPTTYSFTHNTVSELGSQGYDRAWIMRTGFWVFGALMAVGMGLLAARRTLFMLADAALALYGLGIFLTGVFSAAPFEPGISYSVSQHQLHSLFATTAGVMISLCMIVSAVLDEGRGRRVFHIAAVALVMGLSFSFGLAENGSIPVGQGLVQKTMWVIGLSWVLINYVFLRRRAE